jgi:phospholipid/cholesterol/gamma-HCH transport system substrate-binding protein
MVHGFKVGMVTKIYLNPDNVDEVIVVIEVDGDIKLPQDTRAILYSVGLVGGKGIILDYEAHCKENCILDGGYIEGETRGLLGSMLPENEIDLYLNKLQSGIGGVLDSMGFNDLDAGDNTSMQLKSIVSNLASITEKLDRVIGRTNDNIEQTVSDIESFTSSLKENEKHLNNVMANLDVISSQLAGAGLDQTIVKVDSTIDDLSVSIGDLKGVVKSAGNSFENIDKIIDQVENGKGSLGKLIAKDSIYNDLSLTIQHLNLLLQDFRLNPKRYVNVSLIGRKNKEYEKLEEDPAFQDSE